MIVLSLQVIQIATGVETQTTEEAQQGSCFTSAQLRLHGSRRSKL